MLEQEDVAKDTLPWSSRFANFTERIQLQQRKLLARLLEYELTGFFHCDTRLLKNRSHPTSRMMSNLEPAA
jgi:hypothetical protein